MPLIQVVAILIAAVIFLWLVNRNRPMDDRTKSILNVVVVIAVILWLLGIFGILNDIANIHIGR
jgi:hypothetical protein